MRVHKVPPASKVPRDHPALLDKKAMPARSDRKALPALSAPPDFMHCVKDAAPTAIAI